MARVGRLLAALGLASVSLSGCWLQVGFDPGHTRYNTIEAKLTAANAGSLSPAWAVDLLVDTREPIVRGGTVYVATGDNGAEQIDVRAYAATDGHPVWTRSLPGAATELSMGQPSFVGGELWASYLTLEYVLGRPVLDAGAPLRLDPADGTTIARTLLPILVGAPVQAEGHVAQVQTVLLTSGAQLVVSDEATLAQVWAAPLTTGTSIAPAVADGRVFVADGSSVSAFPVAGCGAATCAPTWTVALGAAPSAVVAPQGGSAVYVTRGSDLVAIDPATGSVAWTAPVGGPAPGLAVAGEFVHVAAGSSLSAFPAAGCGAAQCAPAASVTLDAAATAAPVVAGGVVYVGTEAGVQGFDLAQGTLAPLVGLSIEGATASMAVSGGRLFVVSSPGDLLPDRLSVFAPTA